MTTTAAMCDSFKEQLLAMTPHTPTDTYMIALYTNAAATLGETTTAYTSTGEITGTGYTAGGQALTGFAASLSSGVGVLTFNSPSWSSATITADTALIYNSTRANAAVAVVTFTSASSTAAPFTVNMPTASSTAGLIRIA